MIYQKIIKPVLFKFDAELVHNFISVIGESLENFPLEKIFGEMKFPNPVGLAAGFDYNGHLAQVMHKIGFGFNTVGTVTAKAYEGNPKPRLGRLPNSQSLLVNKGFKSEGVIKVDERLSQKNLKNIVLGISIGASNLPEINSINRAIDDYLYTFEYLKNKDYVKYFELNISCPNTAMPENFTLPKNLELLVKKIKVNKPIYVKMPNEILPENLDPLIKISLKYGAAGFIFSNLVKDRNNKFLDKSEVQMIKNLKGNFSGKPCFEGSNKLIKYVSGKYGKDCVIIGCGGVFTVQDALEKFKAGANLIQMITGMVYQGPQIVAEINRGLYKKGIFK